MRFLLSQTILYGMIIDCPRILAHVERFIVHYFLEADIGISSRK